MTQETTIPEKKIYVAKTIGGLEEILADELASLGGEDIEILNRAVSFSGDEALLYKANYWSRTALRILVPVFDFQLADEDDLYSHIYEFPWEDVLNLNQTLAIDAVVSESELTHSHFVALRTKDAIVDRFRERNNGRRPSVDIDNPDVRVNIHIFGSKCDVSLDSSGTSLHKRGYRVSNAEAPMSEVLAAGLIIMSKWDKKSTFIDPMCGSGTLLIEAGLIANNIPPGQYRKSFGFMQWNSFKPELWKTVVEEALELQTEFEGHIIGNDISAKNLAAAKNNIKSAKLHKDIQLSVGPFSELTPPEGESGVVVINPPYGERIKTNDIIGLYREIGDTLKKNFTGYSATVISSDQYALKSVGLKATQKHIVWNGPLECRVATFDLYLGTRKFTSPYPEREGEGRSCTRRRGDSGTRRQGDKGRWRDKGTRRQRDKERGRQGT
ncbi:MAG: RNA methyltransferase [Bacteroidales bacterium]|nr:RNA methyltransferase [Bacteroidales bacterium]